MEIYIVQKGDTLNSIATQYGISVTKLLTDNGLTNPIDLAIGQTLVIIRPTQTYTVKQGDTLNAIAKAFGIPVMQLFRNNPELSDRTYIYPGETLNISFDNNKGNLYVNGFAYTYIKSDILKKTLPYLTYLTLFNYQLDETGDLIQYFDDTEIVQIARQYSVLPVMLVTTLSSLGAQNAEVAYNLITNPQLQDIYIDNALKILKAKGYYGINMTFLYINQTSLSLYNSFLSRVSKRLRAEGFSVFVTVNPRLSIADRQVIFEKVDYTQIGELSDNVTFISYDWGYAEGPPVQVSVITTKSFLDYITTQIPIDKIETGMPTLGYDWQLPYIEGFTKARSMNFDSAVSLAAQVDAVIQYNETALSAYYEYTENSLGTQLQHIVMFKDARSINSSLDILTSYGIQGTGIWNVMYYFTQMWPVINTQYKIVKLLPEA